MALRSLKRMADRRAVQAAQGPLRRVGAALGESRKGTWTPRQVIREHRDEVQAAIDEIAPIFEGRLSDAVAYDRECAEIAKAAAARPAYSNAPGARIGESVAPRHDAAGELESFKAEVQDVLATSPDSETARRRVQQLLATEATRLSLFRK